MKNARKLLTILLAALLCLGSLCLPEGSPVRLSAAAEEIPGATATPEASESPVPSESPDPSESPEATATPRPTRTPRATATPTPTPEPSDPPLDLVDYVFSTDPEVADDPVRIRPDTPETSYKKFFRFSQTVVLKGIFEEYGYFFQIPKYWDTRYCLAQLEYTVSPLIQDVPASLTFFINDHPIYSCRVDYREGASQILFVLIPLEYLKVGYNQFSITGYVRLYDDDGCLDDFSGANWISISESSFIEAGYEVLETNNVLEYYPYPLLSTMDETGAGLTVYVPDQATEEELRAAFMLRGDLAEETSQEDNIAFRTLNHYTGTGNAAIVARADRLPSEAAAMRPVGVGTGTGALVYAYTGAGGSVLVVTAQNDADLFEGVAMLLDEDRLIQEKNSYAFVPSGSAEIMIRNLAISDLIENGDTIKSITNQDGIDFVGPFHQEKTVYLPLSGGFVLGEGGKVELKMRYSDNLDFDRSLVTVYWGDTPVASRKLDREKTSLDVFSFLMPSDVVGTHAASIKIAFDLEIKELYCTKRADQMPWAYVSGESTLYLPAGSGSTYDLALRPYPFQRLSYFNSLAVVVPDRMTDAEYALFGRLAALFGSGASPYGNLGVWYASSYPAQTENRNVILLGTWLDNVQIRALNDLLSFKYSEEGNRFESNQQILLSEDYSTSIAVLQLIRSPWQEGRAILVASAPNDTALTQIDRFSSVAENTWAFAGDAFLIDSELETRSYRFLEELTLEKATLQERLQEHKEALLFTLISTGSMFLILVAVLLILLRYRRNRREEEKK